jgi:hypothetical protein
VASRNGSQPVGAANYASQRGQHGSSGATSQDPDALTAEIERTREDLAETLDAIAERVSPKRVASRTKVQVAEAVARLKQAAIEQTAQAKQTAEVARVRAVEQAQVAKVRVLEQADAAREKVQPGSSSGGSVPLDVNGEPSPVFARPTSGATLPPVAGVHVDGLHVEPDAEQPAAPSSLPPAVAGVKPEYVTGGALVLLLLLLLRLRLRRRRKKRLAALAAPVVKPVVKAAKRRR